MTEQVEIEVEIETGDITNSSWLNRSEADVLYDEFKAACSNQLADMLVQPHFNAAEVPAAFAATLDQTAPLAIARRLEYEKAVWRDSPDYKPLTRRIGELALHEFDPSKLRLTKAFELDMKSQFESLNPDFSELEHLHRQWESTHIFTLLSTLRQIEISGDTNPNWLSEMYRVVRSATQRPDLYTPPAESPEALYLITFMPGRTRTLTRRLLVGNHVVARLESELGEDLTEPETEMLNAIRTHYTVDALTGQHWDDPAKTHKLDTEISVEMALLTAKNWDALGIIQECVDKGEGEQLVAAFKHVTDELNEVINDTAHKSQVRFWKQIDVGHGFENFWSYPLGYATRSAESLRSIEYAATEKTGDKAVILEDDPNQMSAWQQAIENHSPLESTPELSFESPEGILEHSCDPDAKLFLLDIQNGEDMTAGIRVGEALLRERLARAAVTADSELDTHIVIWSSSSEMVTAAGDHFKAVAASLPPEQKRIFSNMVRGSGGSYGGKIHLDIKDKRLHDWKAIAER